MRRSKPLAAVAAALRCSRSPPVAAAATTTTSDRRQQHVHRDARPAAARTPTRQGPAPEIEGATEGGTITVYLPGDPGPDTLDPTDGWSVTGNSIQQALTTAR